MGTSVKSITKFVLAAALLASTACEIQKSENPLSPSLAGPLPGVTITAPHGKPPRITDVSQPWDEISISRAPSSDGIDVDSCQHVVIRNSTISVGDDCIALKGTKGPLAMEDATSPPVEDILVEDCDFQHGHGMLTCGSEATIVRNVVRQVKLRHAA